MTQKPRVRHFAPILTLLTLLATLPASAAVIEKDLPLDEAWRSDTPTGRWLAEVVANPEADSSLPPTLTWYWLLPEGEQLASATLIDVDESTVAPLARSPRRLPLLGDSGTPTVQRGGDLLWSDDFDLEIGPPQQIHGRQVQAITLHPFRESQGALRALRGATLRLETGVGDALPVLQPLRADFPLRQRLLNALGDRLLNPESLPAPILRVGGDGFPTDVPGLDGAAVDMVIVTVDSFADLCQVYANSRTNQGVPTVVRTLEWMAEHYPHGSDRAEMLRNFAIDAYSKWSLRDLLLVGDAAQIPPRYAYTGIFGAQGYTAPTDMYFACLDGDWNADHDAFWAEAADTASSDPGDVVDWLAELNVGRLPAGTRSQCQVLLAKQTTYRNATMTPYQDRILMLGEVLFPTNWEPGQNIITDGAEFCDSIYSKYTGPQQHVVRLYENYTEYPGSLPLTVVSARDSMQNGFNIVLHNGHGERQTMHVGNGSLDNYMASQLTNGPRNFLLYMINCTAGAFDYNSIAESFMKNANGGAWAVIGSTRETFANISALYMDVFFDLVANNPEMSIGELYMNMLAYYADDTLLDSGHRWAHSTFTLMADPSLFLHFKAASTMSVNAPASFPLDGTPLTLTVTGGMSAPVPDARVVIRRGNEDYQWATTNGAGQVTFSLKAETSGSYFVSVEARDFKPIATSFQGTNPASTPRLHTAAITVNDVTGGSVVGNGNGIPERGETVRLNISVRNDGSASASNVAATLSSSSPEVTIVDATDSYGSIATGATAAGAGGYLIAISDFLGEDEVTTAFSLAINASQGSWSDDFFVIASGAELSLNRGTLDDSAGGNGDGILDDGETADYGMIFDNWGRGDAVDVTAVATPTGSSSLTVNSGTQPLGDLSALSQDLGPATFNVTRSGVAPPELLVVLTDAYGHEDSMVVVLDRPVGVPGAPSFSFGSNPTKVTVEWGQAPENDAYGYRVYRAPASSGPYVPISTDWVRNATFEDPSLDVFTSYWYRVEPLSAAGLAGVSSDSSKVTTSLPVKAGWPQTLALESGGTPVVGDVNGDGVNEIFVGADKIYGYDINGNELYDGDANPLTKGPISSFGGAYRTGPLTMADVTSSPGLEVVAGSWDTGEVVVFEFTDVGGGIQASIAPGWPQDIASPGGYGLWAGVTVGDVNGDHSPDILVTDIGGYLNGWRSNGTALPGFPISGIGSWTRSTTGLADIDADGAQEIFLPTSTGQLRGYRGDGTILPGFPKTGMTAIYSSPAIGDVDDDGRPDIVTLAENDSLYVFRHDGTRVPGWPIYFECNVGASLKGPSPVLADVTGDGAPEIFAVGVHNADQTELGWLDASGAWLPGWPVEIEDYSQAGATVGDLDGDGSMEVILPHANGHIDAWHVDGTPVDGFPLVTSEFARSSAGLIDVDQDGLLDLIFVGWDRNVYIWEFPTTYDPDRIPWYTYMHDFRRTGNRSTLDWVVGADDAAPLPAGQIARLEENWPNPFNPSTNIRFTVGGKASQPVVLEIYDVRGRRLRSLERGSMEPGTYVRNWDGRDDDGGALASGIYFARLRVGTVSESKKLTLLK